MSRWLGARIGHHGDVGAVGHGHQLEAGQLQHGPVRGPDGIGLRQQGMADVAAHMDGVSRRPQKLGNNGGGGGLAVGAGDGDDGAGADLEKASISEVMTLPLARAASSSGASGRRPGVRKITSWSRP